MANWCNVRLIIAGRRSEVLGFSRLARVRPSSIFKGDMLWGETAKLSSTRVERLRPNLLKKVYDFQVRNDDGLEHFRGVSRQHPALRFVLVYADPNGDEYGSYFISRGRARSYAVSDRQVEAVMAKHNYTGADTDSEEDYWGASFELMDLAEAHWQQSLVQAIARR
jgi:hypothetical protein